MRSAGQTRRALNGEDVVACVWDNVFGGWEQERVSSRPGELTWVRKGERVGLSFEGGGGPESTLARVKRTVTGV